MKRLSFVFVIALLMSFTNIFAEEPIKNAPKSPTATQPANAAAQDKLKENVYKTYKLDLKPDDQIIEFEPQPDGYVTVIYNKRAYYLCVNNKKTGPYEYLCYKYYNSPQGYLLSYCAIIGGKWHIITGEEKSAPFDEITLVYGENNSPIYHVVKDKKHYLLKGKELQEITERVSYLDDKNFLAYQTVADNKYYYLNKQGVFGPFDDITNCFNTKSGPACIVKQGACEYRVIGKKKQGPFDKISKIVISYDLSIYCIIQKAGKNYVISGDYQSQLYDSIDIYHDGGYNYLLFENDQHEFTRYMAHFVCRAVLNKKEYLLFGKETYGPYEKIGFSVGFSSGRITYTAMLNGKWHVFKGKDKSEAYDEIDTLVYPFLYNPATTFYKAKRDDKWYFIFGKRKYGPYENIWSVSVSGDESTFAFAAMQNDKAYMIKGAERFGPYSSITYVVLSNDGKNLAYSIEEDGHTYIMFGKDKFGPYDAVNSLVFSSDNSKLAYFARNDNGWYACLGKDVFGPYEEVRFLSFHNGIKNFTYQALTKGKWRGYSGKESPAPYDSYVQGDAPTCYRVCKDEQYFAIIGSVKFGPLFPGCVEIAYDFVPNHIIYLSYKGTLKTSTCPVILFEGKEYPGYLSRDGKQLWYFDNGQVHLLKKKSTNLLRKK